MERGSVQQAGWINTAHSRYPSHELGRAGDQTFELSLVDTLQPLAMKCRIASLRPLRHPCPQCFGDLGGPGQGQGRAFARGDHDGGDLPASAVGLQQGRAGVARDDRTAQTQQARTQKI